VKCIHCGTDNTYKDRANRSCKKCGHAFAFEPKSMGSFVVTDPGFKAAIEAVSQGGGLAYTPRQLYYQILRPKIRAERARKGRGGAIRFLGMAGGVATFVALAPVARVAPVPIAALAGGGIGAIGFALGGLANSRAEDRRGAAPKAPISYERFCQDLLAPWTKAHGPPAKMLPAGGRAREGGRAGDATGELGSYSFERLLVCDRDETVDLLLANNFHLETNTPVVGVSGYPQDAFAAILAMTRRNPNLVVYALHDADPDGCLLPLRLREEARWFPQPNVAIVDLGLRPRQVPTLAGLIVSPGFGKVNVPPALGRALTPGERQWLANGYRAELAALPPDRLMRAIYTLIQRGGEEVARARAAAASDPRGFFQTRLPGARPAGATAGGGASGWPPTARGSASPTGSSPTARSSGPTRTGSSSGGSWRVPASSPGATIGAGPGATATSAAGGSGARRLAGRSRRGSRSATASQPGMTGAMSPSTRRRCRRPCHPRRRAPAASPVSWLPSASAASSGPARRASRPTGSIPTPTSTPSTPSSN
jgi:hypothetical protein